MKIEIEIDELVLHGLPPGQRRALGEAMKRELARRLAEPGNLDRAGAGRTSTAIARIDGGSFALAANAGAEKAGNETARVVSQSLQEHGIAKTFPAPGRKE